MIKSEDKDTINIFEKRVGWVSSDRVLASFEDFFQQEARLRPYEIFIAVMEEPTERERAWFNSGTICGIRKLSNHFADLFGIRREVHNLIEYYEKIILGYEEFK